MTDISFNGVKLLDPMTYDLVRHPHCRNKLNLTFTKDNTMAKPKSLEKAIQKLHSVASEVERQALENASHPQIDITEVSTDVLIKKANIRRVGHFGITTDHRVELVYLADDPYTNELMRRLSAQLNGFTN